ncbi:unnamed protein product [Phytomonas sp. Hart1]|nr:unnamed protein product [Phytomonas sp. Hart1]|eukprot:CCW71340.1 unnamed protein product [Phytomonas sp. isolate Hart1]
MYSSLNSHSVVGSDSFQNASNLNMNNVYMNTYPGTSGDQVEELYAGQPQRPPPSNAFGDAFLYPGNLPQGSSSQSMPSGAVPPSSVYHIPLQAIPRNIHGTYGEGHSSGWAYPQGVAPHCYKEDGPTSLHWYAAHSMSQARPPMGPAGAPVMAGYPQDPIASTRVSAASSLSVRTSGPGENGAGPIGIPGTALSPYGSLTPCYPTHPSSHNDRAEDRVFTVPDNLGIPPPGLRDSTLNAHQFVTACEGPAAPLTSLSSSTPALSSVVIQKTPFSWTPLHSSLSALSISGPCTHGINAVESAGTDAAALSSTSFPPMRSFCRDATAKYPPPLNNRDNDCSNDMGRMMTLFNEKSREPQVMANLQQCSEIFRAQEREIAEDEAIFMGISTIERTLMELLAWSQTALTKSSFLLPTPTGCSGSENAATGQYGGVVIKTQAGQVEMDLQVSSYLVERLEYVEEQLSPLETIFHKLLHKYIISDVNSILNNNNRKMTAIQMPSGHPKAPASQPVPSETQDKNDVFTNPQDIKYNADSSLDPSIALASLAATHFKRVPDLNLISRMPEELSKRYERIRQLLLDDILLLHSTTSSHDILNSSNYAGGFFHKGAMNLGDTVFSTLDFSHRCHGGDGDQPPYESLPLRLIMVPDDGKEDGRHSLVSQASNKISTLDLTQPEERPQQSNLAPSIAEMASLRSSGRNTISSTTTLLSSSLYRGKEQFIAIVATSVRYAQHQLFLTVSTAVEHLNQILHLGQLRNEKELQKACEKTQTSTAMTITNTVPDEALLFSRINLQKDAEVFRMWTNRVEALQNRLQWIKRNIDTAVKGHGSVRREVLEILNQRLNNEEGKGNGDGNAAQGFCDSEGPGGPRETESELDSPGRSTVEFRQSSSLDQPESTCLINSNDVGAITVTKATEISLEGDPLSNPLTSCEAYRLNDFSSTFDANSSEQQLHQLCQVENVLPRERALCIRDEKEDQSTQNTPANDFGLCANNLFEEKGSDVALGGSDPSSMAGNGNETESLGFLECHERSVSNRFSTDGTMGTADCVRVDEPHRPHGGEWEPTNWCEMTCQDEGATPTHQAPLSLPHDTGFVAFSVPADISTLDGAGSLEGSAKCKDHKVFNQCHPQFDYRSREYGKISRPRNSDDYKWCVGSASRDAFLPSTKSYVGRSSVFVSDSSEDDSPMEYSLRNSNNLFKGFKAFFKAVVRRATRFDSDDDDDSSSNSRKRQRIG